jgi:hypothetical protein
MESLGQQPLMALKGYSEFELLPSCYMLLLTMWHARPGKVEQTEG